ncbi:MAG: hypothetical protein QGG40_02370 [Myxococcota bacterium]|nr:hypothetical protein [Myxococcota bacterium]
MFKAPLSLLLFAVGCAPPPSLDLLDSDTAGSASAGEPSIRFIFPQASSTLVYCPDLVVSVDVDSFSLSDENIDGDNVEGEGHWHLTTQAEYLGYGVEEWLGVGDLSSEDNQVLPLPEGTILLKAELASNDHMALDPETYSVAEVTVSDEAGCLGGTQDSRDTGDTAQE